MQITTNVEENLVIFGDFNSHNRLWEPHCNNNDRNCVEMINFTTNNNLTIKTMAWTQGTTFIPIDLTLKSHQI